MFDFGLAAFLYILKIIFYFLVFFLVFTVSFCSSMGFCGKYDADDDDVKAPDATVTHRTAFIVLSEKKRAYMSSAMVRRRIGQKIHNEKQEEPKRVGTGETITRKQGAIICADG